MKIPFHGVLLVGVTFLGLLVLDGPWSGTRPAAAQGFGRGRDGGRDGGGGESREDRRERWRRSMGGGNNGGSGQFQGGRDRGGDGERRGGDGERRDGRPNSSGSGSSSSSSGSSDSKSSSSGSSSSMSQTEYAKGLVKMHDKNGDNMLQAEERKGLTGRPAESDLDKDGVITIDELVAHLSTSASTTPAASPSSSSDKSSNGNGDSGHREGDHRKGDSDGAKRVYTGSAGGPNSKEGDKRRTYRFSTTADRLPKNLPSYFSRDTNGDGQVSMSEYSKSWSKSTVAEFRKYDLNDDGLITAKEATNSSASGG